MAREKTGSIYYDSKDQRWKCAYYTYNQDTSKEIRKTKSFLSETEAKDFLTSIEYQKGNELFIKNNGIPLGKFMREILNKKLDLGVIGEASYVRSLETIKKIEKSSLSKENISDITSKEIQEYLNSLRNYSQSYISKIKEKFSQAFREASNEGYIIRNPMNKVILPKSNKETKVVRALELEEQQALTDYLMSVNTIVEPYKTAYLMQMYLGLRIGEALAVKSTDIDLQNNLLKVRRTLTTDKNGKVKVGETTKTYAGKRDIPIPMQIRDEIVDQMRIAEEHNDKFLFVDSKGNRAVPDSVNRRLKEILKPMGITDITSHSLRHTYGTRCIEAGMRAVALQRIMGHKDISVTLNTYTSVFNKYKESELEKVNEYYMNNALFGKEETIDLLEPNELQDNTEEEHTHER